MTWIPLLLADPSPTLRLLVLRDLLGRPPDDPEVLELFALRQSDALIRDLLSLQQPDGSWRDREGASGAWRHIRITAQALLGLAYFGHGPEYPAVERGALYLFSHQQPDGSWPLPRVKAEREFHGSYSTISLQTSIPLRALAAAGYAADPRSERAYEWLLACRLPDGAWHSGVKADQNVFPAGYRRLAHSRYGCRTNTSFALSALAFHPERRHGKAARGALDLLLAQQVRQTHGLGYEVARAIGLERARGFFTYFARYDAAFMLDLCWRVGASLEDERVAALVDTVTRLQGPNGLWTFPPRPAASRWLTFDLLRSLSRIDQESDWVSLQPRTAFQPYPKQQRRY
jgi:hypothetical protein